MHSQSVLMASRPAHGSMLPFVITLASMLLVLAGAAAGLLVVLRLPPPLLLDVGAPGDSPFLLNFYQPEDDGTTTFRWSGPGSRLQLYGASSGATRLRLRLNGDRLVQAEPATLWLRQNQRTVATLDIDSGWRVYEVLLPPGSAAGDGLAPEPLALVSALERPGPLDDRYLGLPLDWLQVVSLEASAPLQRVLLLTWGLALLAGVLWLLDQLLWTHHSTVTSLLRVTLPLALLALLLVLAAWRNLAALALALPLLPVWLAGGTLLLFGVVWLVHAGGRAVFIRSHPAARRGRWLPVLVGLLVLAHAALWLPLPLEVRGIAVLVVLLAPGALLALLLFRHEADPPLLTFLALCGGMALLALLVLALHALPGDLPGWLLLLACDSLSAGLLLLLILRPLSTPPEDPSFTPAGRVLPAAFWAVLLLGAALRLLLLGSAEFQGDESRAVMMAAGVQYGQDEMLLLRPKGPVEVLYPAGLLVLLGQINEWVARLPFALAGIGVLTGTYLLARRLCARASGRMATSGVQVGLLAALLLALDGFLIAFSRIVQYQSIILLLTLGALWCGWRFYEGVARSQRYLLCAAVLMAVAMLSHYDGVFGLPVLGWLVLAGGWRRGWRAWQWVRGLALPTLTGAGLLLSFYVPFVLNEHFASATTVYLGYRLRSSEGTELLFNNLGRYFGLASFYSTVFQMVLYALALLAGLVTWLSWYSRPRWLRRALVGLLLAGSGLAVAAPTAFDLPGGLNWAVLAFGLPLAGLSVAPATPAALRVLVLWFAAPFVAMAFLIGEPRSHFYTMHPAGALLVALATVQLLDWLRVRQRRRWAQAGMAAVLAGLVLLSLPYLSMAYLRREPEYLRDFPASRPALYRAPYGDALPANAGFYAFQQRDGWKAVAMLFRQGVLQGDYTSNIKPLVTGWYARGVYRCSRRPTYYFLVRSQSFILPEGYHLTGYVLADHVRKMEIYSRKPAGSIPQEYELNDYSAAYDALPVESFPTQRFLFDVVPQYHLDATWQQGVRLRGYDQFAPTLGEGNVALVSLYWQAQQPLAPAYEVVVDLLDSQGRVVAGAEPHCGGVPPARWYASDINSTAFRVQVETPLPPGSYRLRVGLRHRETGAWLPLADGSKWLVFATLTLDRQQPGMSER